MPNKTRHDKRGNATSRRAHGQAGRKGDSVKALLATRAGPALGRVREQAAKQNAWRKWLEARLDAEVLPHLSGVVERGDTLVVFTESAAWSARVRYAVAEIEPAMKKAW